MIVVVQTEFGCIPISGNITIHSGKGQHQEQGAYLQTTERECFCPTKIYSMTIVKATVVRLRVVYIGTLIPRTDSIDTTLNITEALRYSI